MAFIFADGFDHYTVDSDRHLDKWDEESSTSGFTINSGTGQGGSDSLRFTSSRYLVKFLSDTTTLFFGFWVKYGGTSGSETNLLSFLNSTTFLCELVYNDGLLYYRDNDNIEYYVPGIRIQQDREYYIEGKIVFSQIAGSVEIHVDGESRMTRTGIDTGSLVCDAIRFGPENATLSTIDFDDFYLLDDTGSTFNDFLGPLRIETLFPNAVGTTNAWSLFPGGGETADQNVDDNPPDDDTTYNFSSTVTDVELYNVGSLSTTSGTVDGVIVNAYTRKDGGTARNITLAARENVTQDDTVNDTGLSEQYKFIQGMFATNPDTGSAWLISAVNAAEFGVKVSA